MRCTCGVVNGEYVEGLFVGVIRINIVFDVLDLFPKRILLSFLEDEHELYFSNYGFAPVDKT